jgi:GntR family transcriptional regulator, arabinose operon transcriptional repressor
MDLKNAAHAPVYLRVYSSLRQRIEAGEWNFGAMLPSEIELSEIYHASRGTLRHVLANLDQEGLVSRQRGRGTFITFSPLKRSPSELHDKCISFIVPYVRDSFVSSILLGLEREARLNKYAVFFSHFENDPDKQEIALRTALERRVSGIALYPVNSDLISPTLQNLKEKNFPLVLIDRYIRGLDTDYVASDNFSGGLIATQHLLSLNHTRIAFLEWSEGVTTFDHRRAGYRQALQEAGLQPQADLEWTVQGYPEIDQVLLQERLSQPDRPSAIFAANDQLAIAVQKAASAIHLSIPKDLALVGFDNLDISAHLDVRLTTVAQPAFEMGQAVWELLNFRFLSEPQYTQKRLLPVQLIVRHSCGAIGRPGKLPGKNVNDNRADISVLKEEVRL